MNPLEMTDLIGNRTVFKFHSRDSIRAFVSEIAKYNKEFSRAASYGTRFDSTCFNFGFFSFGDFYIYVEPVETEQRLLDAGFMVADVNEDGNAHYLTMTLTLKALGFLDGESEGIFTDK